ncbi:uncharacterized protein MICPUCDRAFT_44800 [Micromonas pusilla CCMP1545]|uniref:formate C-acetyltransferase n=1 Tax=Micromonas pusilla (strain CCMP1545) TaxID=564608 RepID=C1N297_MICPC|nr:uncharacterized protein MICPUCDRAFT_44800 [Micromonas pusilla CCMP1545]EEH53763.1 predicted protein [Micromonas pusilla CCMP1545]|eukprot:XP_003062051.1 predicted protein [Micromonas pusilla CCMP1545]
MPAPPPPRLDVAAFVAANVTPCDDDLSKLPGALADATEKTTKLWSLCRELLTQEFDAGVLAIDATTPSSVLSHDAGYIDGDGVLDDVVPGLQTSAPLVRGIKPLGGMRLVKRALAEHGVELDADVAAFFDRGWRRTHNDCVFDLYTQEMRLARRHHLVTGLPDAYGRGRVIGDYRRVALYGVDAIAETKRADAARLAEEASSTAAAAAAGGDGDVSATFRRRDELALELKALEALKTMAARYGADVSRPASNAREAVRWTYLAFLAACKENDGAAISLGRLDAFFDVYIERDLRGGVMDESDAQELIDHFVIKLRLIRQLRPKAYDEIFAGDPVWATCAIAGESSRGGGGGGAAAAAESRHLVTKTSWRFMRSLANLGAAPEPNMTVLWSPTLPSGFKRQCARTSIDTSSVQYINDGLLRRAFKSDDVAIACCVSGTRLGVDAQFFGARCNLAKLLLLALNGGLEELSGARVAPASIEASLGGGIAPNVPLRYDDVRRRLDAYMDWLATLYRDVMALIHWSHDRYCYEAAIFSLIDTDRHYYMAYGVAGLSVVVDSLSAIKHAKVTPMLDAETGLIASFETEGTFPAYGNDDDAVDAIAVDVVTSFMNKLRALSQYRDAEPTLSVLTITSNVMYGKHTGATPDGRPAGAPFAPGANPMHGRDASGALSSLNSVAKVPYAHCKDGISNTFSIPGPSLGKTPDARVDNLAALLDGYFDRGAQHLNVNVLSRETLIDAMNDPMKYPNLTVRVSGYAVNFNRLSREHQEEVIARTFHAFT